MLPYTATGEGAVAAGGAAVPERRSEFLPRLQLSINLSEEYTDNIALDRGRRTEYLTTVQPALALKQYSSALWDWDIDYSLALRKYALKTNPDDISSTLKARGHIRLIDSFLFLDISDAYEPLSLVNFRSEGLSTNQNDRNTFTVSPYIQLRPAPTVLLNTGYQYTNKHTVGRSSDDTQEHKCSAALTKELTAKASLLGSFEFTRTVQMTGASQNLYLPTLGASYTYAPASSITIKGGYSWTDYDDGAKESAPYWDVQINYAAAPWNATFHSGVTYNTDKLSALSENRIMEAGLQWAGPRDTFRVTVGYNEIRRTGGTGGGTSGETRLKFGGDHQFTERVTAQADLGVTKIKAQDTVTQQYVADTPYKIEAITGFSYLLTKKLNMSLVYKYTAYQHAFGSNADGYTANDITVSGQMSFL